MNKDLPGHIKKAFRSVERYLPVVDLIVELVDARMPNGSRLRDFVGRLSKESIIALSKSDLADKKETEEWIKRYQSEGKVCMALDCRSRASVKALAKKIRDVAFVSKDGRAVQMRKVRRVMVIGIPNVGKSTLINSLAGRSAARTANKPGVTRSIQWIKLSGELELLDLPGILDFGLLRRGEVLKLINTMPGQDDDTYTKAKNLCELLISTQNAAILPGLEDADYNYDTFIENYAKKMNFVIKGGNPDLQRATNDIIKRFQSGGFGPVTLEHADNDFSEIFDKMNENEGSEDL
ncbi:MAG: 50S ribosome-binding GTPase [Candidatus Riflebacteria bacterium]|nr:50S ribosome-binding GTPase [Candidatus Riflebacteria bacterium]